MLTSIKTFGMYNFKSIGKNSTVSPRASIYGAERIVIGDNVRIDDFCILSAGEGGIVIGNNIHIACYASIIGAATITLEDYSQVGSRSSIMSSSDDFTGEYLVGPCVSMEKRNVYSAPVTLRQRAVLGINVIVLPGVTIGYNARVGAMSLVNQDLPGSELYYGIPVRVAKTKTEVLPFSEYEKQMEWHKEFTK